MSSMESPLSSGVPTYYIAAGGLFVLYLAVQYADSRRRDVKVPTIGGCGLLSYYGAIKFMFHAKEMLQEGYDKYKTGIFKVPELERWHVVVTTPQLIEELRKAPDDLLSLDYAIDESLAVPWTLGPQIVEVPYHVPVLRSQFTRNLGELFDDIRDEIVSALGENIPKAENTSDGWIGVPALETVMNVIARTSNRVFVGLPLCREPEYIKIATRFTLDVVVSAKILAIFPKPLRQMVGEAITSVPRATRRAMEFLRPVIEERLNAIEEYGKDYADKPADLLSWLIDVAEGNELTVRSLTLRILMVNFAAVHTTSMSLTHVLYHLAAEADEYVPPLREEIERVVKQSGWSKASVAEMRKLDSFVKESMRYNGIGSLNVTRMALKDCTLSNGTFIPAGTFISASSRAIHYDDANYDRADVFDGFRFENLNEGKDETKYQAVGTAANFLSFGYGKHSCPGRFYAAIVMKLVLAHIIMNYDLGTVEPGVRPPNEYYTYSVVPNRKARVKFRRRQI